MNNLEEYYNIMTRYKNGKFGNENLSMYDILSKAGNPELLDKLDLSEIQYLLDSSSGMTKHMFSILKENYIRTKE